MLNNSFSLDAIIVRKVDIMDVAVDALHALSVSVGWPHRADDWQFLRDHGQQGFAAVDESGRVHATAMWFPFSEDFATIGMVITSPRLQAKGGGSWLMRHVLERTEGRALGLHSTRQSHHLYLTLGFKDEVTIYRHEGVAAPSPEIELSARGEVRQLQPSDLADVLALDRRATGIDREPLLTSLIARSQGTVLTQDGRLEAYALQRRFGRGMLVGPVVAGCSDDAVAVVQPLFAALAGSVVRLDTGDSEGEFSRYLSRCGLPVVDTVTRMSLRRPWPLAASPTAAVYAVATQATG
jgi:GNAT superfamily N-acetyltransferase